VQHKVQPIYLDGVVARVLRVRLLREIYDYGCKKLTKIEFMEILNFEQQPQGSYELALFDIDFGEKWGMILRRFKLCKSKNGHFYFSSSSYKKSDCGADGKPEWKKYADFHGEKGKDFSTSVMEMLKPYIDALTSV
jgi:hypothetical protein